MTQPRRVNLDEQAKLLSLTTPIVADGAITAPKLNIDENLTFNNNEITDFRIENVSADPVAGNPGRLIWRTDTNKIRVDDGISFSDLHEGHLIEDEGIALPQRDTINFIGTGVTVTDIGGKTQVDVSGNPVFAKDFLTVSNIITDHTITLSNTPETNSEIVSWNGLELKYGFSNDYTILGNVITLNAGIILTIGDEFQITYAY